MRGAFQHCEVCLDGVRPDVRLPTMAQIRYFVHSAGSGSFAATGRDLGVDRSTVQQAIGALERLMAVRLFDRTTTAITLTQAGRMTLPTAQRILYLATALGSVGE